MSDQLATLVAQLKERRALTLPERIKSLDIRDEIWRKYIDLSRSSIADPIAAQRTGFCSDMCCERERLTREHQRVFNSYESDSSTKSINPALMVTAYSRASADQAMPSPYDLRSGAALLNTMNYLITNVMDKFDQEREPGEWYGFLWDRLRAIRKELTQQHLHDEVAIEILEQSARFHIFCSAFLSDCSRDLFDPKLNDQGLTDCLNQLRHCYTVQKQSNNLQALKNLDELSSYMLLISLRSDNETLLLNRKLIRNSTQNPQISIALQIQRALIMSNTTKIFSLIEKHATLLQSCLLHRYFDLIRLRRFDCLMSSARPGDEFRLSDLVDILGMNDEDEARDYLEQLGYAVNNTTPASFTMTKRTEEKKTQCRLSEKLIKSKYHGNLKDIISGQENTPVMIIDNNVENSFDLQGAFIGKLPDDLDKYVNSSTRKTIVEQTTVRSTAPLPPLNRRAPSESAMRSLAATTTVNTFTIRSSTSSSSSIFTNTVSAPTTVPLSPFRFGGFPSSQHDASTSSSSNPFGQTPRFTSLFAKLAAPAQPTTTAELGPPAQLPPKIPPILVNPTLPMPVSSTVQTLVARTQPLILSTPTPQPSLPSQPPPIARRLSTNSLDNFIDEINRQIVDSIIREFVSDTYDVLTDQWNTMVGQTIKFYDEFLQTEIVSVAKNTLDQLQFYDRMLQDTLAEQKQRHRRKYLSRKYFTIWLVNASAASEERAILEELQTKYHFLNNEQLLEFLTGLQLISEHELTVEQTRDILKSRRILKKQRQQRIEKLTGEFFDEFLHDEFRSLVIESNDELDQRKKLLANALNRQRERQRDHYLSMKYFSLWLSNFRRRRRYRQSQKQNKRSMKSFDSYSCKKRKDHHQKYEMIRHSFDQIDEDLQQIQLFVNQLT